MMHELIAHYRGLPTGFQSYSLLLIPNYDWLKNSGMEDALGLLTAYKKFGDIIGPNHFSGWFFREKAVHQCVDTDIIATLGASVSTVEALTQFIKSESGQAERVSYVSYDCQRARHICAKLGLSYSEGPFVAFFDSYPELPYFKLVGEYGGDSREALIGDTVSTPTHVIRLGGLPLSRTIVLLDQLEAHLLRQELSVGSLRANQFWQHTQSWLGSNLNSIVKVIELVGHVRSKKDNNKEA